MRRRVKLLPNKPPRRRHISLFRQKSEIAEGNIASIPLLAAEAPPAPSQKQSLLQFWPPRCRHISLFRQKSEIADAEDAATHDRTHDKNIKWQHVLA